MKSILFILLLIASPSFGDVVEHEFNSLEGVNELLKSTSKDKTLVVVDVDNTILTTISDLGGVAWFDWQSELLKEDPDHHLLVANNFSGLLDVQGILFAIGKMRPTEPNVSEILANWRNEGVNLLALTARGHEYRSSTEIEFRRNAIRIKGVGKGKPGTFNQVKPELVKQLQWSDQELAKYKLTTPRPVSYQNGIFMAAGQHKGAMLALLLQEHGLKFDTIVFADDSAKNIAAVKEVFESRSELVHVIRYGKMDEKVRRFNARNKEEIHEMWKVVESAIKFVFPI